ncbi:MAG: GNAT family N-acetyltransferase [Leptolyngbyaceae cyanobacterium SM1_1_3]|nr:GNAT family N-acetyltransferase [Leptolyngbyaceae cyanobacterium SM1_1_3]NJN03478.1 GNAT family N-acetyltransferase [Leptolyngbyaceae cyanobacterium RM1_1_2]NJO09497.1 GNAT family N-acetyltransferase [Leptolyngbyaceae cyanobacterium SL_1_1]
MPSPSHNVVIRPIQYRDLDALAECGEGMLESGDPVDSAATSQFLKRVRQWYGPLKFLSLFPNPLQKLLSVYVAERDGKICGMIQVSPFNHTRSTWEIQRIAINVALGSSFTIVGSQLLRYCFEKLWEARTWLSEVNVNNKSALALYRQNGFQPLAQVTYWSISSEVLAELATREPDLPNLLPVSNADAQLLYQLDTAAMPPLVRQVFDHQIQDFKTNPLQLATQGMSQRMSQSEVISAYVFEPQRKAAIGRFELRACRDGSRPHFAQLIVHPAYTWLYPELLTQMAQVLQAYPGSDLHLSSRDYQPEREEVFAQIGAAQVEHGLMMSRSVWHKLRESKTLSLEGLQLPDVLQGLQPSSKPVPGRISWAANLASAQGQTPEGSGEPDRFSTQASETVSDRRPEPEDC